MLESSGDLIKKIFFPDKNVQEIVDILAEAYQSEIRPFSYRSAIVAEHEGKFVGFVTCYPGQLYTGKSILQNPVFAHTVDEDRVAALEPLIQAVPSGYYLVENVAVRQGYRRRGIGHKLILSAEKKANDNSSNGLILFVSEDNLGALELYENIGFLSKAKIQFTAQTSGNDKTVIIMMVKG
jgi:ribosomal protein S18 acetylase RimI-like enzyme